MAGTGGARKNAGRKKGGQSYFQKKIIEGCEELVNSLLSDDIVKKRIVLQEALIQNKEFKLKEGKKSSVYIIKSNDLYKIGYTTNLKNRFAFYKVHNPNPLILFYAESVNAFELESLIHQKYKGNRKRGEWFSFSNEEIINVLGYVNSLFYKV